MADTLTVHAVAQFPRFAEIFIVAVVSCGIAVVLQDLIPKKAGSQDIPHPACVGVAVGRSDEFGNLRVAVFPFKYILVAFERSSCQPDFV